MPMPTSALTTNFTVERCTSRTASSTSATATLRAQRERQVAWWSASRAVKTRVGHRRLDHAATAAEGLAELLADQGLDRVVTVGRGPDRWWPVAGSVVTACSS